MSCSAVLPRVVLFSLSDFLELCVRHKSVEDASSIRMNLDRAGQTTDYREVETN